jgi:hypothetical protein
MPPGSSVTITYDAVVVDTAPAGSIHVNTASADYNSQSDGSGRDGSTPGSDDDNDADLDNYNESDTATLTLDATLAIQKTIPSGGPCTPSATPSPTGSASTWWRA